MFKKIWTFIVKSSADPKATSLSIKFALLGAIPYAMQALDLVCQFGHQCYDIDPSLFTTIIDALASGVFYTLSLVSVIGTLWGLGRKLYRTFTGRNEAIN